jgi:hypothetical protein
LKPSTDDGNRMQRSLLLVPALVFLATSCASGPGSDVDDRTSAIYASVVHAVVSDGMDSADGPGPVFVASADPEQPISLEVQAAMVDELHDFATLRFVDESTEAIDEDDPNKPVVEEGVLVELGPIRDQDDTAVVDAERYENAAEARAYLVRVTRRDETWTATLESTTSRDT